MKINLGAKYTKLDDNVSFKIVRTNPALTTNVKLLYDGSNMFLESYDANNMLKSSNYKHYRVFDKNLYNIDLKKYWSSLSDASMFDVSKDNDIYTRCVESVSDVYDNRYGIVAPLYIKEKLPEYFVIFRVSNAESEKNSSYPNINNDEITLSFGDVVFNDKSTEEYIGMVNNFLNACCLSEDMLNSNDVENNKYYQELSSTLCNFKKTYDLKPGKRFKNDISICNEMSKLKVEIDDYRSRFFNSGDNKENDIKTIVENAIKYLMLFDKLHNKSLDRNSPLTHMAYHCYKNNLSLNDRIDYYNSCFKKFSPWKFKKYGNMTEMTSEMERILAFYGNVDIDTKLEITINSDNNIEVINDNPNNVLQNSDIVKTFDLSEHTTLGKYIRNYIKQPSFEYDKSVYVDNDRKNIYYYGIDKKSGQLTKVVDNFENELLNNQRNISYTDNYITSKFKEKGIIFPYIINLEFLFDDEDVENNTYYGLYCNAIDLYQYEYKNIADLKSTSFKPTEYKGEHSAISLFEKPEDKTYDKDKFCRKIINVQNIGNVKNVFYSDGESIFYVRDNKNGLHKIPQYRHDLYSQIFNESKYSYERSNVVINRMLGDYYNFNKFTVLDAYLNDYKTHFNYVDPYEVFNNMDFDLIFGYKNDNKIVECERYEGDGYNSSIGFFINEKPVNGSSIRIRVINKNLKYENGDYHVAREIHLTAKDENIEKIHDRYFATDINAEFPPYEDENYPDFGNMYKEFPVEDETFVFGDADGFSGDVKLHELKEAFLTLYGKDCNCENCLCNNSTVHICKCGYVAVGITYKKGSTTVAQSFMNYDVKLDEEHNTFICTEAKNPKRIDRETVFKDEAIEELLGFKPTNNYVRGVETASTTIDEIRIYPEYYVYRVEGDSDIDDSDSSENAEDIIRDFASIESDVNMKLRGTMPFLALGTCKKKSGEFVGYKRFNVLFTFADNGDRAISVNEQMIPSETLGYYNTLGEEDIIKEMFGEQYNLAEYIKIDMYDDNNADFDVIEVKILSPKITIKHYYAPADMTDEERAEYFESLKHGAYDRADKEHFGYLLRDENYKNLFITSPMKPGSFHVTRNDTIYYSTNGTTKDIATAICNALNTCTDYKHEIEAYQNKNLVVLRHAIKGEKYNGGNNGVEIEITFDTTYVNKKFFIPTDRYNRRKKRKNKQVFTFTGGSNNSENTFIVKNSDIETITNGYGHEKFIKTTRDGVYARVTAINPFVDKTGNVDYERCIMTTDKNGKYISTGHNRIEFVQQYFPKVGLLSFFPVKDFDTDMIYSTYGDVSAINKEFELTSDVRQSNFKDMAGNHANSEYDYHKEYDINFENAYGKSPSFISKWASSNNTKDSCDNPYRLNMSKIFGEHNLSTDTKYENSSLEKYTHDLPYIIMPKYMYNRHNTFIKIDYTFNTDDYITYGILNDDYDFHDWDEYIKYWERKLMTCDETTFEDIFSKKYSNIKYEYTNGAYTIFKGVKFNIGKDAKKYDGYKFSFLYIPAYTESDKFVNKVYFVKNDICKFICGFMFVNVYNTNMFEYLNDFVKSDNFFNKSYIYNMINDKVVIREPNLSFNKKITLDYYGELNINNINLTELGFINTNDVIEWSEEGLFVTSTLFDNILKHLINNSPENPRITIKIFNGEPANMFRENQYVLKDVVSLDNFVYENNILKFKDGDKRIKTSVIHGFEKDVTISFNMLYLYCSKTEVFNFFNELASICNRSNLIKSMKPRYNIYSSYNIRNYINDDKHVEYVSYDGCIDFKVDIEDAKQLKLKNEGVINRYDGNFEPLFRDILHTTDTTTIGNYFLNSKTIVEM